MKFTTSWLQDHIKINVTAKKIAEILTNLGLEVEKYTNLNDCYKKMYICEITKIKKHPNADKLSICDINTGKKEYSVVCGAKNVKIGLRSVFAGNGTFIPGKNFTLESKNIRGVTGDGMLCSEEELNISNNSKGIIELDKKYKIGSVLSSYFSDEYLFEIGLTPNRGDCASVRGISRELAAKLNKNIVSKDIFNAKGYYQSKIKWDLTKLNTRKDCPVIIGRHFEIESNNKSPKWLKNKLMSIGLSPISSLVDITNYILFDIGRPLHVFDAKKIKGNIKVRKAKKDELFQGLDNKSYRLSEQDLVIADDEKVLSLAGIMGGLNSCVDENTKEVFLEVAFFDPVLIANTGRRLNITTDSRYRFERGVDPEGLNEGVELATQLIKDICGGKYSVIEKEGEYSHKEKKINYIPTNFNNVVGYNVAYKRQLEILKNLNFNVEVLNNNIFVIDPPSWRNDISTENDIIEEIARVEGYENIPFINIKESESITKKSFSDVKNLSTDFRERLAHLGLTELVTFTFISPDRILPQSQLNESLILSNPISKELSVMRNSLLPNLLDNAAKNFRNGAETMNTFEIGSVFFGQNYEEQKMFLSILKSGFTGKKNWLKKRRMFDFFDLKSDIYELFQRLKIHKKIKLKRSESIWYHPGKAADIIIDDIKVGSFGEIHPLLKNKFGIKLSSFISELELNKLIKYLNIKDKKKQFRSSQLLSLKKDFAFLVSKDISAEQLVGVVRESSNLIGEILIFDIYKENLKNNNISIAIEVEIKQIDKIFKSEDINSLMKLIIKNVEMRLGGKLRF